MKPVKSFDEYRQELMESRKLNEGILDVVKKAIKKVGEFFSGVGSKFLNALIFQDKGELPKSVKIYPNQADLAVLKKDGITPKEAAPLPESYSHSEEDAILEAKISLEHPDPKVQNIDTKGFKFKLETILREGQRGEEPNPLLIWGAPGIGKTAIIEQVAKFHDMSLGNNRLIVVDLSTMRPEDFFLPAAMGGVGKDYEPTTKATRLPVEWLPLYDVRRGAEGDKEANGVDDKGGIIFFDEIARCAPEVQDICLKLCDDSRRIGNFKLGSKWVIVAAANRGSDEVDSTKTFNFSSTLGNRFKQYNFAPKFEDWAEWATTAKDKSGDLVVMPEIFSFLNFFREHWHDIDPDAEDTQGGKSVIFPTPRAWTKASQAIRAEKIAAKEMGEKYTMEDMIAAVSGSVGQSAANAFKGFLQLISKINPKDLEKVYTDPKNAPTLEQFKTASEQGGLVAAAIYNKKDAKLTNQEIMNFVLWLTYLKDAPMAMKGLSQFLAIHPEVRENDYYITDCRNVFFDSYPSLMKQKKAQEL
jgi:hypothetical protein